MSHNLTDFVAILTHSSLDRATPNKMKDAQPLEFYGVFAFPPEAGGALHALAMEAAAAFGGLQPDVAVGVQTNAQKGAKAIPGIPGDWFIVRAATQYAPYVADATGAHLDQSDPAAAAAIRTGFYAGKKVRASLSGYGWTYPKTGKRGVSFNLVGVMAAGDGERLNVGVGKVANTFAGYATPNAQPMQSVAALNAAAPAQVAPTAANPFAQQAQVNTGAPAQSANPFAQQASASNSNPFTQSA